LIKKCVEIFNSDYDYEKFKTNEHLQSMIYVHLNEIKSLRTLEFDKGYCDYNWWNSIYEKNAFFVTRLKNNAAIQIIKSLNVKKNSSILEDNLFSFSNSTPRAGKKNLYTSLIRRISIKREGKPPLILVTNLLNEPAEKIANLYKSRWAIELFFKWIKQRLKIKKFLGKSENAVKIQLITAIIAYILVFLFKNKNKKSMPLYLVLVWIKCNLAKKISYRSCYFYKKNKPMMLLVHDSC
jgi:putative transposase